MNTAIKYVAQLAHVREVTLLGDADLGFWQQRLVKENLVPVESDGKAQLLMVAADAKFMGIRFREVSFSVLVSLQNGGAGQDAAFLLQAFNSSRCFAFCERAFFKTPYDHGDSLISTTVPVSIRLTQGRVNVLQAQMAADAAMRRKLLREGEESWTGPVFLPRRRDRSHGHLFFANLRGNTRAYPFLRADDTVAITPAEAGVFQALRDSRFAGREWVVREDATHSKSKTYSRRQAFFGGEP